MSKPFFYSQGASDCYLDLRLTLKPVPVMMMMMVMMVRLGDRPNIYFAFKEGHIPCVWMRIGVVKLKLT